VVLDLLEEWGGKALAIPSILLEALWANTMVEVKKQTVVLLCRKGTKGFENSNNMTTCRGCFCDCDKELSLFGGLGGLECLLRLGEHIMKKRRDKELLWSMKYY